MRLDEIRLMKPKSVAHATALGYAHKRLGIESQCKEIDTLSMQHNYIYGYELSLVTYSIVAISLFALLAGSIFATYWHISNYSSNSEIKFYALGAMLAFMSFLVFSAANSFVSNSLIHIVKSGMIYKGLCKPCRDLDANT